MSKLLSEENRSLMRKIVSVAFKVCYMNKDAYRLTDQELISEYKSMGNEHWTIEDEVKDYQGYLDE